MQSFPSEFFSERTCVYIDPYLRGLNGVISGANFLNFTVNIINFKRSL